MGIKDLNKVLQKHTPEAFINLPLSTFTGKRIAIDGSYWIYTNMAIARKRVIYRTDVTIEQPAEEEIRRLFLQASANFLLNWLQAGILPIIVLDGTHLPEKQATKAARGEQSAKRKEKIAQLYQELPTNILQIAPAQLEELRKYLAADVIVTNEDYAAFIELIHNCQIPLFQAHGEGEQTCAMLCREGYVAGVFSADTDTLTYGCPLLITKFGEDEIIEGERRKVVQCVRLDKILIGLQMNINQFVDLCILLSCDFNTNIPKYGPVKCLQLITQYGSIDKIPATIDKTCLQHQRCRQIFKTVKAASTYVLHQLENTLGMFEVGNKYADMMTTIAFTKGYVQNSQYADGYIEGMTGVEIYRPVVILYLS